MIIILGIFYLSLIRTLLALGEHRGESSLLLNKKVPYIYKYIHIYIYMFIYKYIYI
jgi:hypothetical protein